MKKTENGIYEPCSKAKIALEALRNNNTAETAKKFAIPQSEIEQWVQQLEKDAEKLFEADASAPSRQTVANKKQTALLKSTLEASPNGILATDMGQNVISFNQRCVELWKLPEHIAAQGTMEAAMPHILQQVKHPQKFLDTVEEIYTHPDNAISQIIELKDGRYFKWHSVPYRSGEKILGRVATFEDITEYKKTERKLTRIADLLNSINANVNEAIIRSTPDEGLIYVNKAMMEMFGYHSVEEVLKTDPACFYTETADRDELVNILKVKEHFKNEEVLFKRKDGSTFWGLENSTLVESNGKKYIDSVVTDIDNWKKAQQDLLKSEEKYRTILKNIEEGYFETNLKGDFTFFNSSLVDILRYPVKQMMGMNNREFMSKKEARKVYETFNKIYRTGNPENAFDWKLKCGDGSQIYVETSITLRRNSNGDPIGFCGVVRDVTERKKKEKQIHKSLKEKEVLLGEIHHRVKNNLAVISGLLYLQAEKTGEGVAKKALKQSQNRINSMALIHELLYDNKSFSSISPDLYIRQLVNHISSNLANDACSISTDIEVDDFDLEMNTAIPCALIINELITNAYKYAFEGRENGVISIAFKKKDSKDYLLEVSDDGVGMPEDFRLDDSSHHSLGISLVKTLTRQLNGELCLIKRNGAGFKIEFPAQH